MSTLHDLTEMLLNDSGSGAAEWLRLADIYIQAYNRAPGQFILPREHVRLKPLIEAYASDLPGFVEYLLGVRDTFTHDTTAYAALHKLYRTISTRALQQQRRERLHRAVEKAIELRGSTVSFESRMKWVRSMEQEWGKRRLEYMEQYRKQTHHNRLSVAERSGVLDDFWAQIDDEIAHGDLPPLEGE